MREDWAETTLGETCMIQQGTRVDHLPVGVGDFPVLGATGVVGSWTEATYNTPMVAMGCRGTVGQVRYVTEPAWFGNNVMAIGSIDPAVLGNDYLSLALEGTDLIAQGAVGGQVQKQITRKSLTPVRIALPPPAEQRRIVDLVGALDDAIDRLLGGISSAEAARGFLLNGLLARLDDSTLRQPLGEVGAFIRGKRFTKADYVDEGLGCIHYGQVHTHFGAVAEESLTFVPEDMRARLRLASPGDVVIAAASEDVEGLGTSTVWLGDGDVAVHDDCYIFQHQLNPLFATHLFASADFHHQKVQYASGTKVVRISGADLARIQVPVPLLEDQVVVGETMRDFDRSVSAMQRELSSLRELRSHLLTALLSGEHEIPESYDELLEVAS